MVLKMAPPPVEILILGAGWTSTFLIPLLTTRKISFAATSTTGRDDTIPFRFDPTSSSMEQYRALPSATTVLITFPLTGSGQSRHLTDLYRSVHGGNNNWIQLGSTGIYKNAEGWTDRHSDYDKSNARAVAEDELIECVGGCVLNLSGLYGGQRDPKNWLGRLFKSKEDVRGKGAVHLVHGQDVARAIVGVHQNWKGLSKSRWIVTDLRVYDWWDLGMSWGGEARERLQKADSGELEDGMRTSLEEKGQIAHWVGVCMLEEGVKALPRNSETLGRRLDARQFWHSIGAWPSVGRVG